MYRTQKQQHRSIGRWGIVTAVLLTALILSGCQNPLGPDNGDTDNNQPRLNTVYVSTQGDNDNDGASPDTPMFRIAEALKRIAEGGTIMIAAGTYNESVNIPISVHIFGSYSDNFENIDFQNNPTIIDAAGTGKGVISAWSIDLELADLILQNGITGDGGGIRYDGVDGGSLSITKCWIIDNEATEWGGGGIVAYNATINITDSKINNNIASRNTDSSGGGIAINTSSFSFDNTEISNNDCNGSGGGGVVFHSSTGTLNNCIISVNSIGDTNYGWGGGIHSWASNITINECSITGNIAAVSGGGLNNDTGSNNETTIINSNISDNTPNDINGPYTNGDISYTITYNANSATSGTVPSNQIKTEGIDLTLAINTGSLTKNDYTFAGWNTLPNGLGSDYSEGATYTTDADLALYAKWTVLPAYTVSYDTNSATSGTAPSNQTKTEGIDLTLATNTGSLTKTDYTFAGWNTSHDGLGSDYSEGAIYSTNADLTLYAKWTALPTYTVSYSTNSATSGTAPGNQTKTEGINLTLSGNSGNLERDGYTFSGWNTADDGNGTDYAEGESYSTNADLILHAKWTTASPSGLHQTGATTSHITMEWDTVSGSTEYTLYHSSSAIGVYTPMASTNLTEKTDYGRNPGTTYYYKVSATSSLGESPLSNAVSATTLHQYTITYNANSPTSGIAPSTQTKTEGVDLTLASNTGSLTKTGYTFAGWNTADNGNGTDYAEGASYSTDADLTLHAKWTVNDYIITFDMNDTEAAGIMNNQTITFGTSDNLSSNTFSKTGWTFEGWATTSGGSVAYTDGASYTMGSSNVTLYAKWIVEVSFNKNDLAAEGNMNPQGIESGTSQNLSLCTFTKTGWTFAGWSTTSGGSVDYTDGASYIMGSSSVTLYAQWTAPAVFAIGDRGPAGGWIMYINENYPASNPNGSYPSTWHYIEAAPQDISNSYWAPNDDIVSGAQEQSVGYGFDNTIAINTYHSGSTQTAAKKCINYSVTVKGTTYSYWYLPSGYELIYMYQNLQRDRGVGDFITDGWEGHYWSSSCMNSTSARFVDFEDGAYQYYRKSVSDLFSVRPIRYFE